MTQVSINFRLSEFVVSETAHRKGIDNTPSPAQVDRIRLLVKYVLQPARTAMGTVFISSGYRCEVLNTKLGGAAGSQHTRGEAADIKHRDMARLFEWIRLNTPFDQLIWEYGDDTEPAWVHVSYTASRPSRGEVLKAYKEGGKTKYIKL